jgi:Flp pilus assembly protein TadD
MKMKLRMTLIVATALAFATPMAWAAGDTSEPAAAAAPMAKSMAKSAKALGCKTSEVGKWSGEESSRSQSCTTLASGVMPDDELYEQGKLLATEGEYDWALSVLALISKQDDAKVLNYIGYSHRKAGRLETGIEVYKKALALDPNFVQARAYLGEAYVLAGKKDMATAELLEIKTRCGADCSEYKELEKAIAAN